MKEANNNTLQAPEEEQSSNSGVLIPDNDETNPAAQTGPVSQAQATAEQKKPSLWVLTPQAILFTLAAAGAIGTFRESQEGSVKPFDLAVIGTLALSMVTGAGLANWELLSYFKPDRALSKPTKNKLGFVGVAGMASCVALMGIGAFSNYGKTNATHWGGDAMGVFSGGVLGSLLVQGWRLCKNADFEHFGLESVIKALGLIGSCLFLYTQMISLNEALRAANTSDEDKAYWLRFSSIGFVVSTATDLFGHVANRFFTPKDQSDATAANVYRRVRDQDSEEGQQMGQPISPVVAVGAANNKTEDEGTYLLTEARQSPTYAST